MTRERLHKTMKLSLLGIENEHIISFNEIPYKYQQSMCSVIIYLDIMDKPLVPFSAGSPIVISGPTGSGKTVLTYKILTANMFTQKISKVLYCYGVYQDFFNEMKVPNIEFHEGVPTIDKVREMHDGKFNVIVLDDLMEYIVKNVDMQNLFTKHCHHFKISALFLTQNIFAQGPCARSISLNAHILILFKNKRDESQIINIGKQLYPYNSKIFLEAFQDATSTLYGYLVIDCDPRSPKEIKL